MVGAPTFDTVLDVCEHKHRRIVLAELAEHQQSMPIDDLAHTINTHNRRTSPADAADETIAQIQTGLTHVHLPKLAAAGFIQYGPERDVVEPAAHVMQEASHLSALLAVDPALPSA